MSGKGDILKDKEAHYFDLLSSSFDLVLRIRPWKGNDRYFL